MIPLKPDLIKIIKMVLAKDEKKRMYLLPYNSHNSFNDNLSDAIGRETNNQIMRISYECERYVKECIIEGKSNKFMKHCYELRHGVEIVMSTYVKLYVLIPSLAERVKNHFKGLEIKKEEVKGTYKEIENSILAKLSEEEKKYLTSTYFIAKTEQENRTEDERKAQQVTYNNKYKENNRDLVKARDYARKQSVRDKLPAEIPDEYKVKYRLCKVGNMYKIEQDLQAGEAHEKLFV
jgi:hypothetical protein